MKMKFIWVGALLVVSSSALARPCHYNARGEIDWNLKCRFDGESGYGLTCDEWAFGIAARANQIIVGVQCFNGESPAEIQEYTEECRRLAQGLLNSDVKISDCDTQQRRPVKKVRWSLARLTGKKTLPDGTPQGIYKKIKSETIKR